MIREGGADPGDRAVDVLDELAETVILNGGNALAVPPERMPRLLENMLDRNRRLQLVALRSIAAAPLVQRAATGTEPAAKPAEAKAPTGAPAVPKPASPTDSNVYRHGVEFTVQGSYADIVEYLAGLEQAGLTDVGVHERLVYDHAQVAALVESELHGESGSCCPGPPAG